MKSIFSLIGILFMTSINAQKFDCSSTITTYQEHFKLKNIADAFDAWSQVRKNCPKTETVYTDGVQILQYKIDNAANAEEKEVLVRDLMKLYDQYNKNFPANTIDFEISKAMALYNNQIEASPEILSLLESGFSKASDSIADAKTIYVYYSLNNDKYKSGDQKYNADFVLDRYTLVNGMLTRLQQSNPGKANDYKTAQNAIQKLAKDLVTCDNLSVYYEKKYPQNKNNYSWVAGALNNLSEQCSAKPIFTVMAQDFYAFKATSQSANFMALASLKQKKFEEAVKFYNEAADLESDPQVKAKIHYTLATGLLYGDKAKAKENLNKALEHDPKMGRAYLFLADLYANAATSCGKTEFEKKAINYLAVQTAKKAATIETTLKATADKMAEKLASKTLSQSDINKEKMNGKSITIGCWINETITFPAK